MATIKKTAAKAAQAIPAFTKAQLLASEKYKNRRDLLSALLDEKKKYTAEQLNALIEQFMKGKVN